MAGCLGRQGSLSALRGGGEDAEAPKGSERTGWVVKKNPVSSSCALPAWATLALFAPTALASTHLDSDREGNSSQP